MSKQTDTRSNIFTFFHMVEFAYVPWFRVHRHTAFAVTSPRKYYEEGPGYQHPDSPVQQWWMISGLYLVETQSLI